MWQLNHIKSVLLPKQGEYVNFQNFERLTKASFIKFIIEFALIPSTDNINFGPSTKKY